MSRIIAVNSNCYHGFSLEEAIKGISDAGFRYIELTATKGWTEHVFVTHSFERLLHVKQLLRAHNLTPFSMSGHCNLMDTQRIGDFLSNIYLAAFFGCSYIVSSIGEAHLKDEKETDNAQVAEHIRHLVPTLAENNIMLVLETHGEDHGTGKVLSDIIGRVDSKSVRMNYDTANAIFYGGVDLKEDISCAMDDIAYMHLKDKAGAQKEWNFPALGEGDIDFPMVFDLLDRADNTCPFSVEIEFTQSGPKDLGEVNEAVKTSAAYLKRCGFAL